MADFYGLLNFDDYITEKIDNLSFSFNSMQEKVSFELCLQILSKYWNVDVQTFYPFIEFIFDEKLIYYALRRFIESGRINFEDPNEIKQIK